MCVLTGFGLDRVQVGKSLLFSVLSWLPAAVARETLLFLGHMIWSCFLSLAGYKFANQRALGNLGRQSAYCPSQKMGQRSNSQSPSRGETTCRIDPGKNKCAGQSGKDVHSIFIFMLLLLKPCYSITSLFLIAPNFYYKNYRKGKRTV